MGYNTVMKSLTRRDGLNSTFGEYFLSWYKELGMRYTLKQDTNGDLMIEFWNMQKESERPEHDK